MNYYTSIVPAELVERLYEAGCPNIGRYEEADGSVRYSEATYADIFDGLIEKGLFVEITRPRYFGDVWRSEIVEIETSVRYGEKTSNKWREAADKTLRRAIRILNNRKK